MMNDSICYLTLSPTSFKLNVINNNKKKDEINSVSHYKFMHFGKDDQLRPNFTSNLLAS